jgi:hypothetical protein
MRHAIAVVLTASLATGCGVWEGLFDDSDAGFSNGCAAMSPPQKRVCQQVGECRSDQDCFDLRKQSGDPDPSNWTCAVEKSLCLAIIHSCSSIRSGECCPGQRCEMITDDDGVCADDFAQCDPAEPDSCTVKGQFCSSSLGTRGYEQAGCTFRPCSTQADCAKELVCFNGSCVGEVPCDGGCSDGAICVPTTNRCYPVIETSPSSCRVTCAEGKMLVFADPTNLFICDFREMDCTCAPKPQFAPAE